MVNSKRETEAENARGRGRRGLDDARGKGRREIRRNCPGAPLRLGTMQKTTSRKLARRRLLEAQQDAAAARERRERANLTDLTEFTVRMASVDEVDEWFAGRVEKLKDEAQHKRLAHRSAAGKALHAMRLRGETMASISSTTGLSVSRLRELMKYATDEHAEDASPTERPDAQVVALPNRAGPDGADDTPRDAAMGAH